MSVFVCTSDAFPGGRSCEDQLVQGHSLKSVALHPVLTACFALRPGPPAGLIAQRINVYRGTGGYRTAADQSQAAEQGAAVRSSAR